MNIIELEKVTEDEKNVILHFAIPKDMVNAFKTVFHGFLLATEGMSFKIRNNETQRKARIEAHHKEVRQGFDRIKDEIRKAYRAEFETLKDTRTAFKNIRKQFRPYGFLVSEVHEEIKAKRELEILRLHNSGYNSLKISDILGISPGHVRKVIWESRKDHTLG